LGDVRTHQGKVWNLPVIKTVCLNSLSRCKGTKQNDDKYEANGLNSHLVLLSTQKVLEFSGSNRDSGVVGFDGNGETLAGALTHAHAKALNCVQSNVLQRYPDG